MSDRIEIEEVSAVEQPPRARVEAAEETPGQTLERKRDYLEGFLAQKPAGDAAGEPGGALYEAVVAALKEIYDPEIPVNIVDLGLVYDMGIELLPSGTKKIFVKMTLTAPGCGMGATIAGDAQQKILTLPGVEDASVEIVWDPPWHQSMITAEGRRLLGLE